MSALPDYRAEHLARELCKLYAQDPDGKVIDVRRAPKGPFGSLRLSADVMQPEWMLYAHFFTPILEALDRGK